MMGRESGESHELWPWDLRVWEWERWDVSHQVTSVPHLDSVRTPSKTDGCLGPASTLQSGTPIARHVMGIFQTPLCFSSFSRIPYHFSNMSAWPTPKCMYVYMYVLQNFLFNLSTFLKKTWAIWFGFVGFTSQNCLWGSWVEASFCHWDRSLARQAFANFWVNSRGPGPC